MGTIISVFIISSRCTILNTFKLNIVHVGIGVLGSCNNELLFVTKFKNKNFAELELYKCNQKLKTLIYVNV